MTRSISSLVFVSAIASAGLAGDAFAQSVDAPPSTPGGFRATLYDKAGGELFWQRSTDDRGAVRGYEITLNGRDLGIRDALSYYDPSLEPGTPYTFTVAAVDGAGQRSAVATTTLGGGTAPPPASDGPDAPADLRAAVYSRRSAELFWRREPAALALRYEIRRDGQVVGTTDGISYYTNDLAAGTDYAFEVIAIDRDGSRSSAASIAVRTDGDSGPTPTPTLAAPANLRSDVYSRTNAELFWDRASTPGLRYEVTRDGAVVGTTNGTSFYDDTLAGGTTYAYEVIALDGDRRSGASALSLTTPGSGGGTPEPEVPERLDESVDAVLVALAGYRADAAAERVTALAELAIETAIGSREREPVTVELPRLVNGAETAVADVVEYDCALGGRMTRELGTVPAEAGLPQFSADTVQYAFSECRLPAAVEAEAETNGELVLEGFLERQRANVTANRFFERVERTSWTAFTLDGPDAKRLAITGGGTSIRSTANSFSSSEARSAAFVRYAETENGMLTALLQDTGLSFSVEQNFDLFDERLELKLGLLAAMEVILPGTSGVVIAAATPVPFSRTRGISDDLDVPFRGELTLTASDGRSATVTARDTDTDGLFVDRTWTAADGTSGSVERVPLVRLTVDAPD